jgi:hypothetical protein
VKKTFLSLLAATTIGVASPSVFAATTTHAEVKAAIETTVSKVAETLSALEKGADKKMLADMASEARQVQKGIVNSALDLKRNQASSQLKSAWTAIQDGGKPWAEQSLKEALVRYKEIQDIYVSTH